MTARLLAAAALALAAAGNAIGQDAQAYRRIERLEGTLTVAGSSSTANIVRTWGTAFQRHYPKATVRVVTSSSSAAPRAMVEDAGTIGMMSRTMNEKERQAVAGARGRPPLELKVAIDAVAIYVFKNNPLTAISLEEVERVFSAAPRTGGRAETWGQLGAQGSWAARPIIAFGFDRGRGVYEVMRELALGNAEYRPTVRTEPVSTSVVQGVGVEAGGIGYASAYYRTARTKVLPIRTAGDAVAPTDEAIATGKYPLARFLYLYSSPGARSDDVAREFLLFVLSTEGQDMVKILGAFPIPLSLASSQRAALGR